VHYDQYIVLSPLCTLLPVFIPHYQMPWALLPMRCFMDLCQVGFFFILIFYHLAGFSKKESDNFMRIPSAWHACDFVVGGLHLVYSEPRARNL